MATIISQSATTTTTVGLSNFQKTNTPSWLEKVGNIALLIGMGGAVATAALAATPALVVPAVVLTIIKIATLVGSAGKVLSKLFGEQPTSTIPAQTGIGQSDTTAIPK